MRRILFLFLLLSIGVFAQTPQPALVTISLGDQGSGPPPEPPTNNEVPVLSNFHVKDGEGTRVYFDSSEHILGSTYTGFTIAGKTITGISIQSESTTGHYFTVSSAFNFWQKGRHIEYTGGSDIEDDEQNGVYAFTFRHVENNFSEPSRSGSTYYVNLSGNNNNNGTSEGTAWRTLAYAVSQVGPGDMIHIKAGDYGNESMTLGSSGSIDNPIKIVGYKNTPNNINSLYWSDYSDGALDPSEMPYFNSGNRASTTFLTTTSRSYFIIKNIQVEDYEQVVQATSGNGQVYERILADNIGDPEGYDVGLHTNGTDNSYLNCIISNATGVGIRNENNSLYNYWENNHAMCNQSTSVGSKASTDYYLAINGRYGVYKNNYVTRIGDLQHHGHGFSLKENTTTGTHWVSFNLLEGGTIINVKQAIDFKRNTSDNVIRYVTVLGDPDNTGALDGGIKYSDNATDTTIEFCYFDGFGDGLIEMLPTFGNPSNLTFIGNIVKDVPIIISGASSADGFKSINNTYYNIPGVGSNLDNTNSFTNDIFLDVNVNGSSAVFTYSDFWSGFSMPAGTGNISIDPAFADFVDFVPQNAGLKVGILVSGSEYDKNGKENTLTIGAIQID